MKEVNLYYKQDPDLGEIRGMDPWAVENGIHVIRSEPDAAEGILLVRKDNVQQYGTVHGGMLAAFADTISGTVCAALGKLVVTQSSTISFLRPADGSYLFCKAIPQKVGRTVCVVAAEERNDRGELVTTALFNFSVVKDIDPLILKPKHETYGADFVAPKAKKI